jgi:hypothetical protein
MRHLIFSGLIIISFSINAMGGCLTHRDEATLLAKLFSRIVTSREDEERLRINDSIRVIITSYVKSDSVFRHRFDNLKFLGQITSHDSLVKIINWNLVLENGRGRYYCYIIKRNGTGNNNVYSLSADYNEARLKTDSVYTDSDWYGALYYDIRPYIINNGGYWVLLGIDYGNALITRKIIDILSFTDDGRIIFGKKCFDSGSDIRFREVFEYSSTGMMTLRFRTDRTIVFDHLVPFSPSLKDDHRYYGADYSYDAYDFKNGIFKFILNVDARNN